LDNSITKRKVTVYHHRGFAFSQAPGQDTLITGNLSNRLENALLKMINKEIDGNIEGPGSYNEQEDSMDLADDELLVQPMEINGSDIAMSIASSEKVNDNLFAQLDDVQPKDLKDVAKHYKKNMKQSIISEKVSEEDLVS